MNYQNTNAGACMAPKCAVEPQRVAPILSELQVNAKLRNDLLETIGRLEGKAGPVLEVVPPKPAETCKAECPPRSSGVLGEIEDSNRELRVAITYVNSLTDRLLV